MLFQTSPGYTLGSHHHHKGLQARFTLLLLLLMAGCLLEPGRPQGAPPDPALNLTPTPTRPTPTPTPRNPFLHVDGGQIRDGEGRTVFLRGVNMHTDYYRFEKDPEAPWRYATQGDVRFLASLGATVIRLGLHWRYFETSMGFDLIDTYLSWAEEAGLYVILDMHVVPPEDDILEGKIWQDPAAQARFIEIWTALASRYANREVVAGYDLFNEPNPPDPEMWWELAEKTRRAIRQVDPYHIIFVQGPLGARPDVYRLLPDNNLVYSYHDYTPFVVTHAGADWINDTPVPTDYVYPGRVLVDVVPVEPSPESPLLTSPTASWQFWRSEVFRVPEDDISWGSPRLFGRGNTGRVWFDDIQWFHNGVPVPVLNGHLNKPSRVRPGQPANWFFEGHKAEGAWSRKVKRSGKGSAYLASHHDDGYGAWAQAQGIWTEPLLQVTPGDTLQVQGWIYAPENRGEVGLGVVYLRGIFKEYDREQLWEKMRPYVEWAQTHGVPLFVGEFGSISSAPQGSRARLIADKIQLMNAAGVHWALWAYRDGSPPSFGLTWDGEFDMALIRILEEGFRARP